MFTAVGELHEANLYQTLVKGLREYAIFRIQPDGTLASWNAGVERNLGYSETDFLGLPFHRLFTDEDRLNGVPDQELNEARLRGQASDERWHVRKDGSRLFVEGIVTSVFDDEGRLLCFTKVMRDSTRRRQTTESELEQTLRLAERAHALDLTNTIIRRLDGTITSWTTGAAALYGWTRQEAEGCLLHDLLQTQFCEPLDSIYAHLRERGEWTGELIDTTKDGLPLSIQSRWVLHQRSDGSHTVIQGNMDISHQKRMQRALQQANDELSLFAYGIAHDLQSPLRGMSTSAELLQRDGDGTQSGWQKELTGSIVEGSKKLHQLVSGLLQYATLSANRSEIGPVPLLPLLQSVVTNLHAGISESSAEITWSELPVVKGHSARLLQLFQNLISNAIKYRRLDQAPKVAIASERVGDFWLIRVQDNGVGIDQKYLHKIFAPLQRLHGEEIAGSGLGLAICKRIVESGGGQIWVTSTAGSGSTFHFTLPA